MVEVDTDLPPLPCHFIIREAFKGGLDMLV